MFRLVTGSRDKVQEAERILGLPLQHVDMALAELQAVDLDTVIEAKATDAFERLGQPVLVEDTGLFVEAWNGLPGALIRWFIERVGPRGICDMLAGFDNRNAVARTVVALHDGRLRTWTGEVCGRVAASPHGLAGFGWDSIFVPDGATLTFGEMAPSEKDHYSMRRLALEAMRDQFTGA